MSWHLQYQSRAHAKHYATKRDTSLLQRMSNHFERRMIHRALARLRRRADFQTVLDCASGAGRLLPTLAKFGVSVVALDTSAEMLEEGRRYHHLFRDPPETKVGSAQAIPLPDNSVDVVLCSRLMHHFSSKESRIQILEEFARVARVGVVISIFDRVSYQEWRRTAKPHKDHGRYAISRRKCRREAEYAGLQLLGMNALLRYFAAVTAATFIVKPSRANRDVMPGWLGKLGLSSIESLVDFRPARVAALSRSSDTFRIDCDPGAAPDTPRQIFVKRYRYRGIGALARGFFRGTVFGKGRARLEFEHLEEMRRRGLPAVAPLNYVEDRKWGCLRFSALITAGRPDAEPLDAYFRRVADTWDTRRLRRFSHALGESIAGVHAAGVFHGGLFWRNILVADITGGGWAFTFLDPSRHCQFYAGPAPLSARLSDLSDFFASGAAAHWDDEFKEFMESYSESLPTDVEKESLTRAVLRQSKRRKPAEDRRIAVSAAFAWLQRRIERAAVGGDQDSFDSLDSFFRTLREANLRRYVSECNAIRLEITPRGETDAPRCYHITISPDGVDVAEDRDKPADLVIRTDIDAWMSVLNGRPAAMEAIREGRFILRGDVKPLAVLVKWLDQRPPAATSPDDNAPGITGGSVWPTDTVADLSRRRGPHS